MEKDTFHVYSNGFISLHGTLYKCALGEMGVTKEKKEGDKATPIGSFPLREVYYRSDRVREPHTSLPKYELSPNSGWCNDPDDPAYNTFVDLPYAGGHEELWRDDEIYDLIVVMGYNDDPPVAGKGSALFVHVARPDFTPTAGCVALSFPDILKMLEILRGDAEIAITTEEIHDP